MDTATLIVAIVAAAAALGGIHQVAEIEWNRRLLAIADLVHEIREAAEWGPPNRTETEWPYCSAPSAERTRIEPSRSGYTSSFRPTRITCASSPDSTNERLLADKRPVQELMVASCPECPVSYVLLERLRRASQ
jgi:hypothetical protein